jgi:hypothetical protein
MKKKRKPEKWYWIGGRCQFSGFLRWEERHPYSVLSADDAFDCKGPFKSLAAAKKHAEFYYQEDIRFAKNSLLEIKRVKVFEL